MSVRELIAELSKIENQDMDILVMGTNEYSNETEYTSDFKVEKLGSDKWGYSYLLIQND